MLNFIFNYIITKELYQGFNKYENFNDIITIIEYITNDYINNINNNENVINNDNELISKNIKINEKIKYKRIIAIGDIHGDYEKLVKILSHSKLIDENNNWIGIDTILIQMVK